MNLKIQPSFSIAQHYQYQPIGIRITLRNEINFDYICYLIGCEDEIFCEDEIENPIHEQLEIDLPLPTGSLENWKLHIFGFFPNSPNRHYILNVTDLWDGIELILE